MVSEKTQKLLLKYHLPLWLFFGVALGWSIPSIGSTWSNIIQKNEYVKMSNINVFLIFFLSGLKLKTNDIKKAVGEWKGALYGSLMILIITPLLGILMIEIPFTVRELSYGLGVFCSVPTTLSSGVILTGQANGNVALGLLLTVVTNLLGIVTMPLMLLLTFLNVGKNTSVQIDVGILLYKLCLYIALPLFLGKLIQSYSNKTRVFVTKHKIGMKLLSSFLLVMVPWMKVSTSVEKMNAVDFGSIVACFGIGTAIHLIYLGINLLGTKFLKLKIPERKAVVILASQKTLPVSVTIIDLLPDAMGSKGVMVLPCILSHFVQILIDGYIVAQSDKIFGVDKDDESVAMTAASTTIVDDDNNTKKKIEVKKDSAPGGIKIEVIE
jgi:solute carrier family 10 (sodium/bile acid cotransporter), member 7